MKIIIKKNDLKNTAPDHIKKSTCNCDMQEYVYAQYIALFTDALKKASTAKHIPAQINIEFTF